MFNYRVVVSQNKVQYATLYIDAISPKHAKNIALQRLRDDEIEEDEWTGDNKTSHRVLFVEEENE